MSEHLEEATVLFQKILDQFANIIKSHMYTKLYGFPLEDYIKSRNEFSEICRLHADHIEMVTRDTGMAKLAGGAIRIVSGISAVAGLALLPFTSGVSMSFIAAAAFGGLASLATGATAALIKDKNIKADRENIECALKHFEQQEREIVKLFDEINKSLVQMYQLVYDNLNLIKRIASDVKAISSPYSAGLQQCVLNFIEAGYFFKMSGSMSSEGSVVLIATGPATANLLGTALSALGVNCVIEGKRDVSGSELACIYREFADAYDKVTQQLRQQLDELRNMSNESRQ